MPLTTVMKRWPEFSDESSMPLRVSLVNLQKLTLWAWVEPASMRILAPAQNTRFLPERITTDLHLGMLEAQPLHGIRQFDVDAEIVGIQLELIALEQAAILVDVHGERGDVALDVELPVPVARRIGLKIDIFRAACERADLHRPLSHPGVFFRFPVVICTIVHVFEHGLV